MVQAAAAAGGSRNVVGIVLLDPADASFESSSGKDPRYGTNLVPFCSTHVFFLCDYLGVWHVFHICTSSDSCV